MKIYTKTGDAGTTSLIGGERVKKYDLRVEAYGTVDELTAHIALLSDMLTEDERTESMTEELYHIESQLMSVAALLAVGKGGEGKIAPIAKERITDLEKAIDRMQTELPEISKFTIPGGHRAVSLCHVCRTVCRRAERAALRAGDITEVDSSATIYLNRLSDYLYSLGRLLTERLKVEEHLWIP
ncbi:MAG: cob(I)yrinic acid a,c-diamide adenosyltransferase [Alistipes sp.]|nr:cob(I)yrinic acid a,c-diamide adenosyltransferase [Alistipes sp.]